jgi:isopropylmalate/homocitrate/citramalate synthase
VTEAELIHDWNQDQPCPAAPPLLVDHTLSVARSVTAADLEQQFLLLEGMQSLGLHDFCLGSLSIPRTRLFRSKMHQRFEDRDCRFWVDQPGLDPLPSSTLCYISQRPKNWAERLRKFGPYATVVVPEAMLCQPAQMLRLLQSAVERKVQGFCLSDDSGRALPAGVSRVVGFAREVLDRLGSPVRLEWSGRNNRSLAVANALTAWRSGAQALHCSWLGLGEGPTESRRPENSGLAATEQLLVNLSLHGVLAGDFRALKSVSEQAARSLEIDLHPNLPIVGSDAFRTGTGVHAAAIAKARQKGDSWLADLVYSGVPAARFGFEQIIEIGPMAGASNVSYWLRSRGLEDGPDLIARLLEHAKRSERVLSETEIREMFISSQ